MPDDFDFLRETRDDASGELPDWLEDATDEVDFADDVVADEDDEFERLRQQAVLAANDLHEEAEPRRRGSLGGGFFGKLTSGQRLVLALLFLLNVIIVALGILIVTGTLTF